ncbi:MAG: glycosyltransferase family 4 protein [Chitinophagaceae bacterium]|nr:glycosyltransferase family 4 protein [Chitinophagaceae bacterium]
MKIIHLVLGKVNPERMNGVNKVVYEMATRQHAVGYDVAVWGITQNPVHDYPDRNFITRLFPTGIHPFAVHASLRKAIAALPEDVVFHLHGGFIPVFSKVSVYLKKYRIPFVYTPHGSYNIIAMKKGGWKKAIYLPLFEKPLLRRAAVVHSLGKSEVDGLHSIQPDKKSALIPYGFDTAALSEYSAASFQGNTSGNCIISFCGRIDTHTKGLDLLLTAFASMAKKHHNITLWMIGDSAQRAALEQTAAALGISNHIVFYGAKYGHEKMNLLQQSHLFVHPSRNEGLPTAVLEAAAIGLPCIVSRATNVGEAVEKYKAGWVVEHPDATELAATLDEAIASFNQGTLAAYATAAQQMVAQHYHWSYVLTQLAKMYEACLH